jgi:hypothetical protein
MQTHLLELRSSDQLSRSVGRHKLELCMMVLHEVENSYPSATFIRGIFLGAIDRLDAINSQKITTENNSSALSAPEPISQTNHAALSTSDSGMEDFWLTDPAFWDPWSSAAQMPQMINEQ